MNDLVQGIQNAIAYIEENLTGELEISTAAERAYLSPFYFQRIFTVLSGASVGEYIRNRRLTLAAQELAGSDQKVIDIALKYGYDSPDSFNRAFKRFHGISPSEARKAGAILCSFAPMKIKLTLEGGNVLEYRIVEKQQFAVMGLTRVFNAETSYEDIPPYWEEVMAMEGRPVCGMYGVCMNMDESGKMFEYIIADNYIPWDEIPEGCVTRVIPAGTWVVFPVRGGARNLQDVNTRMWCEWLPSCRNYRLAGNYNVELYAPHAEKPEDNYCEIWLPVEKID